MILDLQVVAGVEIGHEEKINKVLKAIEDRKKARKDLEKRAKELRALADIYYQSNPVKARLLESRGIALANEAYRMKKEDRQSMTYDQIHKSAVLGKCALFVDREKYGE